MSLLERLETKAADTLGDGHWVEKVAKVVKDEGSKRGLADAATAVADGMIANKAKIGGLSAYGFTAMASRLALGDDEEARLLFLRHQATFRQRMDQLDKDSAATRHRAESDEQAWKEVKALVWEFVKAAGTKAIPIILAAV